MKVRLDCQEVSQLISQRQDAPIDPAVRARMRLHFIVCSTCRNVDEQMDFLRRAMRRMEDGPLSPSPSPLPPGEA